MIKKICSKCNVGKPLNEFSKHRSAKDGYRGECKKCDNKARVLRASNKNSIVTTLDYCDLHIPREDKDCTKLLLKFAKALQPDMLVDKGDLLNFESISKFPKDPENTPTIMQEIIAAREWLYRITEACPKANKILILGNHDWRVIKLCWEHPELVGLIDIKKELHLDQLGWKVFDYGLAFEFRNFVFTHGKIYRKHSAYTAKAMLERYNTSGSSGHTHRTGVSYKTDYLGTNAWWEGGCLCDFKLAYEWWQDPNPNWQHAINVIKFFDKQKFHVDQIPIPKQDKFIFYNNKYYTL